MRATPMPFNLITLRRDKERQSSLVRVVKASQKRSTADRTTRDERYTQVFQSLYHFEEINSVGGFLLLELYIEAEELNGPAE